MASEWKIKAYEMEHIAGIVRVTRVGDRWLVMDSPNVRGADQAFKSLAFDDAGDAMEYAMDYVDQIVDEG